MARTKDPDTSPLDHFRDDDTRIKAIDLVAGQLGLHHVDFHPLVPTKCTCGLVFRGPTADAQARRHIATKIVEVLT